MSNLRLSVGRRFVDEDGDEVQIVYCSPPIQGSSIYLGVIEDPATQGLLYSDWYNESGSSETDGTDIASEVTKAPGWLSSTVHSIPYAPGYNPNGLAPLDALISRAAPVLPACDCGSYKAGLLYHSRWCSLEQGQGDTK